LAIRVELFRESDPKKTAKINSGTDGEKKNKKSKVMLKAMSERRVHQIAVYEEK